LITEAAEAELDFAISLKPSHIGGHVSDACALTNLKRILSRAREHGIRVTIDMESTKTTDMTLSTYAAVVDEYDVGCVLQAYLYRSQADAETLLRNHDPKRLHMRICKGIYVEPPELVVATDAEICDNYVKLAETLYDAGAYVCVATHDEKLITHFENAGWAADRFEFQVLLGVPVETLMKRVREKGFKTTAYVPFGPEWHAYSIRRLCENPKLIRYVIRDLFKRR
jgi:proline dehydrogenase